MPPDFNPQPTLTDQTLCLRVLSEADREDLYVVARDPLVWAGHPAKDRYERAVFDPYFDMLLGSGATLAVIDRMSGRAIGCSRYYEAPDHPGSISIGYTFLGRDWWGGRTNFAMKTLMLDHAFASVDTVWLHIDPSNQRSQRATAKLGATLETTANLVMNGKAGRWQCWRIERDTWQARARGAMT